MTLSKIASFIIQTLMVVLLSTLAIFYISKLLPGDPILASISELSLQTGLTEYLRKNHNLDKPFIEQYWIFLSNIFSGNFGISITTNRPIMDDIKIYLPATIELALIAFTISLVVSINLALWSAYYADSLFDYCVRAIMLLGLSIPAFLLAIAALFVFYGYFQVFPGFGRLDVNLKPPVYVTGFFTIDSIIEGNFTKFINAVYYLLLPASVLAFSTIGFMTENLRPVVGQILDKPYIITAKSKGLKIWYILYKHVLPNAFSHLYTLSGIIFGSFITGALMTETVFNYPGIGLYTLKSIQRIDYPVILILTLLTGIIYSCINFIVDLKNS